MDFLYFDIAVIFFLSLMGAIIAVKFKQSTMVGFLIFGLLLSPSLTFTVFGFHYSGLPVSSSIVDVLSQIGLAFLLFFIGLNISVYKFRKSALVSITLGSIDIGLMFFIGFIIAKIFGWDLYDSLFFALIISASSVVVTAKTLEDMKRLNGDESYALLNLMIFEDVLSIFIAIFLSGVIVTNVMKPGLLNIEYLGVISLIAFVVVLTFIYVPILETKFKKSGNDEIFVLFIFTVIFTMGALLEVFNITPALGAFFAGMIFAETNYARDIEKKLIPFKHAFSAIFFITYGMNIVLNSFITYADVIIISLIGIIITEVVFISAFAYILGFSSKGAVFMGAGLIPRSEDSLIFANMALGIYLTTSGLALPHANVIYSITGAIVLLTSIITPYFVRFSPKLQRIFSTILPQFLKYSGNVISRALKPIFFPREIPIRTFNRFYAIPLPIYIGAMLSYLIFHDYTLLIVSISFLIISIITIRLAINKMLMSELKSKRVVNHVLFNVFLPLASILIFTSLYMYSLFLSLLALLIIVSIIILESFIFSRSSKF